VASRCQRGAQRRHVHALDADDLVAARHPAHDFDPGARDPGALRDEFTQRRVRLPVDRRRGHPDHDRARPLSDDLRAPRARLEPHRDLGGSAQRVASSLESTASRPAIRSAIAVRRRSTTSV
jgi:hypothetical protein